jgi:hypothetical protein
MRLDGRADRTAGCSCRLEAKAQLHGPALEANAGPAYPGPGTNGERRGNISADLAGRSDLTAR